MKGDPGCVIEDCDGLHYAWGLCREHYWQEDGSPLSRVQRAKMIVAEIQEAERKRKAPKPLRKGTEEAAYAVLERSRWPNGVVCPHCGHSIVYFLKPANGSSRRTTRGTQSFRRLWKCGSCRRQFTVFVGTPLERTGTSARRWVEAMKVLASDPTISTRRLAMRIGVNAHSAAYMRQRLDVLRRCGWETPKTKVSASV